MTTQFKIPFVTLVESAFFANGTLIVGKTSGARARVVDFTSSTLKLYHVTLEGTFLPGELVEGEDSNGDAISAFISDADGAIEEGSQDITEQFILDPVKIPISMMFQDLLEVLHILLLVED